jgi:hypothetical protein
VLLLDLEDRRREMGGRYKDLRKVIMESQLTLLLETYL